MPNDDAEEPEVPPNELTVATKVQVNVQPEVIVVTEVQPSAKEVA